MNAVKRSLLTIFIIVMLLSSMANIARMAENDLNLPSTPVKIEVYDGVESYFLTKLLDVPEGYSVSNRTYLGWCIDTRAEMTRSPETHSVLLYSSLNPPSELANEEWDMVNYILNHKPEAAVAEDIQQAIWYFVNIDGNYTPTSQTAWEIINDALGNGEGFTPENGQVIAVICYPIVLLPHPYEVQISIIEVKIEPAQEPRPEPNPDADTQKNEEQTKQPIEAWILALIITVLIVITSLFVLTIHRRRNTRQKQSE